MKVLTLSQFNAKIRPYGFEAEAKNRGFHFLIRCRGFVVSYYPTTDRWVGEGNKDGYSLATLLNYLQAIRNKSLSIKMPTHEFICKRVFMATFIEAIDLMPLYGFDSFAEWYNHAMKSPTDSVRPFEAIKEFAGLVDKITFEFI